MVAPRLLKRLGKGVRIETDSVHFLLELPDRLDQATISAQPEQRLMKIQIGVKNREHVFAVDCGAVLPLQLVQLGELGFGNRKRQNARGHDFQFLADRVNLHDFLGREIAHHCAAIWDALYDALLFELKKRKPNIGAMGVEAITQILFDQAFPRVAPPEHNVLLQPRGDFFRRGTLASMQLSRRSGPLRRRTMPFRWAHVLLWRAQGH